MKLDTLAALPENQMNQQLSRDTYFHITNVKDKDGNTYRPYIVESADDSYYFNGFQTIFLLKEGAPIADSEITPEFVTGTAVNLYKSHNTVSGTPVKAGTPAAFTSGEPILYSAASESGTPLRNYWGTFVTQQPGAKLFVNGVSDKSHYEDGIPVRKILLGVAGYDYHDIFIANIGTEKLTGLSVKLEGAENVRLDDYWTISDATAELAEFTTVDKGNYEYGDLNNVAKIRLHRTVDATGKPTIGEIRGKLVITADGNEPVEINLKGTAGIPKITTETVVLGVQYVPYSCVLQTNNMYKANGVEFKWVSGTFPNNVAVKKNGEIYGMPKFAGTYTFKVHATYNGQVSELKQLTLIIEPNEDEKVSKASNASYELDWEQPVGHNGNRERNGKRPLSL